MNLFCPRILVIIFVCAILAVSCTSSNKSNHDTQVYPKATSPLRISLNLLSSIRYNEYNEFVAEISSDSQFDIIEFKLNMSNAQLTCQGQTDWRGSIKSKQTIILKFSCLIPNEQSGSIEAQVKTAVTKNAQYAAFARIQLENNLSKSLTSPDNVEIHKETGRSIREHRIND